MPYTFGYGQQKTKPQEDIRNIPGVSTRGFTQEYKVTPTKPTITQKTVGLVPKPILKTLNSDSPLVKAPLLPVFSKVLPTGFGKETDRLRKRFLDSATFGITGEADTSLGKDVSYREGRSFKDDKLGASLDLAATLAGYAIPGLGWAKAAKAVGLGAKEIPKLVSGATKLQKATRITKIAGQQAKEGIAIGAAIGASEVGVREAINPDNYSAKDNLQKVAIDTLGGAILDPIAYAGIKGVGKLVNKIKKQPETEQVIQDVQNLKNVPEVSTEIKNVKTGKEDINQLLSKISPELKLPEIQKTKIKKIEFTKLQEPKDNIDFKKIKLKKEELPIKRTEIVNSFNKTIDNIQKNERYESEFIPIEIALKLIEFDRTSPKYVSEDFGRKKIDSLKKQILENGLKEPLIINYNPKSGFASIIEGNHRIQALKELGYKKVPVATFYDEKLKKQIKPFLKKGRYLGKDTVLPNEFGEYNAEYLASQILPELNKGKKFKVGFDPIDKKTKLIPTEGEFKKLPTPEKIKISNEKIQPVKKIVSRVEKLPTKEFKEKLLTKKIVDDFLSKDKILKSNFAKENQEVNGSILRYPISTKDIYNPEMYKGRYGQAEFLLGKNKIINEDEYFTKDEIIRLSDIIRKAKKEFNIKYSTRDAKKRILKGAAGYYSTRGGQIKTRAYDDVQTFFHELGHLLSIGRYNLYGKYTNYTPELKLKVNKEIEKYIENRGWGKDYPVDSRMGFEEAMAEFLRRYLFYPEFESKDSPELFKLMNDVLNPSEKKVILELQQDIKKFQEQNLYERAASEISFGEEEKREFPTLPKIIEKTNSFLEKFYTLFVDEQRPIQKALEPYGEQGEKVFREFRLIKGVGGKARQWLENGITDDSGNIIFPSLTEILKAVEKNHTLFVEYIINKRALDLIARGFDVGNKLSDLERKMLVKNLESKFPEFIKAQKQLVEFQQYILLELVKAGKISKNEALEMISLNPNYVPFYRDMDLDELTPQQAKSYGLVSTLFKMKGSTREIIDPIESIVKNLYSFLYVAEKNKLLNKFVNTLYSTTDATVLSKTANLLEKIEVPAKITKISLKEIRRTVEAQFDDEIEKLMKEENESIKDLKKELEAGKITKEDFDKTSSSIRVRTNNKLRAIKGLQDNFDYSKTSEIFRPNPSVVKNRGNVIALTKNVKGKIKTEYYQIVSPDLYNAIVTSDTRDLGFILNALNLPTRIFRTGITSTFEFFFKNLFRDQFAYAVNSKAGYVPYVDLIRGMFHIFGKSNVYQRFLTSGAEQSFRSSLDRNYLKEDMRKIIKNNVNKPKMNVITKVEEVILLVEKLSQFVEVSSKVGNLAKGLKKFDTPGKSDKEILKEAALDSRDLIDFSRRGQWGKNINAVSAFFNSAVQGLDKTVRVFKDPKTRNKALVKGITYITLPTISLYLANRNDPRYQELQDWDKDLFWHFWVGETHYRLPIPFELGVMFKVIPERILSTLDQNDKPWSGFGKTALNTFNFIPSNPSNGFGITLLSPIIQAVGNTNYFGSKIVPMREQFLPPEEKFGYNTSESAKLIGKIVSKIPGYRDIKMLEILATPRYVDNIVQGYFGTLGQYGLQALDILLKPSNSLKKPFPELGSLPGLKAFLAPQVSNTKSFDEFYNEINRLREEYNTALKNNTPFLEKEKKNVYEKAAKILQEFSKVERAIQQDKLLSPIEKRNKIIEIHKLEVNFIRQFLGKPLLTQYTENKNN